MKKALVLMMFIPGMIFGQNQSRTKTIEGKLCLTGGATYSDVTSINQYLQDASLPQQTSPYYSMGFIYQVITEGVVTDLEFFWVFPQTQDNGTYQVSYRSSVQLFNLGYMLVNSSVFHLYPLVGVGRGAFQLESSQITTPTFAQVLTNGVNNFRLDNSGVVFNAALSMDFLINTGSSSSAVIQNMVLGLRGGYIFDLSDNIWNSGGVEVSAGPMGLLSGPYVRIMFGLAM